MEIVLQAACPAPKVFPGVIIVKGVDGTYDRKSWTLWKEGGRYPDVIVELASSSTIDIDLGFKKHIYEHTFHTPEYYCYDPETNHLRGWHLVEGEYADLQPNEQGWLWSEQMEVWLGTWSGEFQRVQAVWLRLYTAEGQLIPTLAEREAQRAEEEARRAEAAEAEVERLRTLLAQHGITPETE